MRELFSGQFLWERANPSLAPVSPRRRDTDQPEQLPLPTPSASTSRSRTKPAPEQAAKAYIARRAKPSVVPGHVKLTFHARHAA